MTARNVLFGGLGKHTDGDICYANHTNDNALWGDGSDGAYNNSGDLTQGRVYNFTSFNLDNGQTLNPTSANSAFPIIIRVQGNCTISGKIDLKGHGYAKGSAQSNGSGMLDYIIDEGGDDNILDGIMGTGGSKGGKRSDTPASGGHGGKKFPKELFANPLAGNFHIPSGTGGGGGVSGDASTSQGGGGGGGGSSYDTNGSNGGSGGATAGGSGTTAGGAGGNGGGSILICVGGDFTFNSGAEIDVKGDDGSNGANGSGDNCCGGGGGGGGGGMCLVLYKGTLTDNGTKTSGASSGGAGGTGGLNDGGNGGAGAAGTIVFTDVDV